MTTNQKKSFFATIGNRIKQAYRWLISKFSYKAESRVSRVLWYVSVLGVFSVVLYVAVGELRERRELQKIYDENQRQRRLDYCHDYWNHELSPDVIYHEADESGYIYNKSLGQRTISYLSWICQSEDGDNLVCFRQFDKRGYFNRITGQPVIPPRFEKAWVFSEGLACVMLNGKLGFVDHNGDIVIENRFMYRPQIGNYCFHGGLCIMNDTTGKVGLIDKQGKWAVEPVYTHIDRLWNGFWIVIDSNYRYGAFDKRGGMVLPCEYLRIENRWGSDDNLYAVAENHVDKVFDTKGNLINAFDFEAIEDLDYESDEFDDNGEPTMIKSLCVQYRTYDGHHGLMDRKGKRLTDPLYNGIEAIGPDRFLCYGRMGTVILDEKGKPVE